MGNLADGKKIFLEGEADIYFARHADVPFDEHRSKGIQILDAFLSRTETSIKRGGGAILEIGCSSGYNLAYLCEKYNMEGFGIEPAEEAVRTGNAWAAAHPEIKLHLQKGTSDELPFEEKKFDIVVFGACLCWVDRRYIQRTVAEADRVLRSGGFLVIEDFLTPQALKRPYKYNEALHTYKCDHAQLFLGNPCYSLIERMTYSHRGMGFDPEIQ